MPERSILYPTHRKEILLEVAVAVEGWGNQQDWVSTVSVLSQGPLGNTAVVNFTIAYGNWIGWHCWPAHSLRIAFAAS